MPICRTNLVTFLCNFYILLIPHICFLERGAVTSNPCFTYFWHSVEKTWDLSQWKGEPKTVTTPPILQLELLDCLWSSHALWSQNEFWFEIGLFVTSIMLNIHASICSPVKWPDIVYSPFQYIINYKMHNSFNNYSIGAWWGQRHSCFVPIYVHISETVKLRRH